MIFAPPPRYRSKENFTSSAVTGSPLWNFIPGRSVNSALWPSLAMDHDSAMLSPDTVPGMGLSSASWSA